MTVADTPAQSDQITKRVTPVSEPIDRDNVGEIQLAEGKGGLSLSNMNQLMDFAKLMAVSQTAIPKHLRLNPGACLAICMHAVEWRMSPFAVANKSYSVNDRLAFEAGMYQAVVSRRAPITGRIKMEFDGDGDSRTCRVWASLSDGTGEVEYTSPKFGKIQPKNSPLWKNDPDQQLFYFSVRAWARRHFSDVMMGIYTIDEIEDNPAIVQRAAVPMPKALPPKPKQQVVNTSTGEVFDPPAPEESQVEHDVNHTHEEQPPETENQEQPNEAEAALIRAEESLTASDFAEVKAALVGFAQTKGLEPDEAARRIEGFRTLNSKGINGPQRLSTLRKLLTAIKEQKLNAQGSIER